MVTANIQQSSRINVADLRPHTDRFTTDVLDGLLRRQKQLPCKYLYDERGALLFERICELEEYYVPRIETSIMRERGSEIIDCLGSEVLLVEYGCGDCFKTRLLLDGLPEPAAYVPIDISWEQLQRVSMKLKSIYPRLELLPLCADYTEDFELPRPARTGRRLVVFFPGSTIGNFDPITARSFLERIAALDHREVGLLIGVDLKKDHLSLHRAYNDREGVTAAFNLNILVRINRELDGDFQLSAFKHYAFYNPVVGRVEMHLISLKDQVARVAGFPIIFTRGESIWTESSYKYTVDEFQGLAASAGFDTSRVWTDERRWFSLMYLQS